MLALGCAYELVQAAGLDAGTVSRIQDNVQKVRQLRFTKAVPLLVESRDQAERERKAKFSRVGIDKKFRIEGQAGSLIGLYPAGIDLKRATLKLQNQVVGFYDPDDGRIVLVKGVGRIDWYNFAKFATQRNRDVLYGFLLGHELTHALQEQHFGLKQKLHALKNDRDRALALESVAEGDADLTSFGCPEGRIDRVEIDEYVAVVSRLPQKLLAGLAKGVPEALRARMDFQYIAGIRFVNGAFKRGGWNAVDALYRQPPQSTQQIIHPELYFDRPTPPDQITIRGYQSILAGWSKAAENTEGELNLSIILKQAFGDGARQVSLAERWAGDRIVSLSRGSELSVIWLIELRDEGAAAALAAAYATALDRRLGVGIAHRVAYHSATVLVVIVEAARSFRQLRPLIFADSQVIKLPAPAPPPARPVTASLE